MNVNWQDCSAYARHVDDQGRETVVHCDLAAHDDPSDATAEHYDERLDIRWKYGESAGAEQDGEYLDV